MGGILRLEADDTAAKAWAGSDKGSLHAMHQRARRAPNTRMRSSQRYRVGEGKLSTPGARPKMDLPGRDCPAYRSVLAFHSPDPAAVHRNLTSEHAAVRGDLSSELASLGYQFGHGFPLSAPSVLVQMAPCKSHALRV